VLKGVEVDGVAQCVDTGARRKPLRDERERSRKQRRRDRSTRRAVSEHEEEKPGGDQRPASDGQKHRRESCGDHQLEGELPARLEERHGEAVQDRPHDEGQNEGSPTASKKTKATSRATKGRSHSSGLERRY
jgi:hypothetical protein